jgi:hypothetical protein
MLKSIAQGTLSIVKKIPRRTFYLCALYGALATRAFTHNVDYAVERTVCLLMAHNLALCYLPD